MTPEENPVTEQPAEDPEEPSEQDVTQPNPYSGMKPGKNDQEVPK